MNTQKEYPLVVQQIHSEFNNAGERLLAESLAIIGNAEKIDTEKAHRLNNVGFGNNPLISKAKKIEELTRTPAQMAELVLKYRDTFPMYKFISNGDIDKICKKYNLVKGSVEQYTGFVPEKNLKEIEKFKQIHCSNVMRFHINKISFQHRFIQKAECNQIEDYIKSKNGDFLGQSIGHVKNFLSREIAKGGQYRTVDCDITDYVSLSVFDICAPKKEMISNDKFRTLKGLFNVTFTYVPDPVVLFPVTHGAIIVTAWGDEASDELVVNQQLN